MLTSNFVPARDLQKAYKSIIDGVKITKKVVILTTNKEPQAAIVSLEDLKLLQRSKASYVALEMLKLARDNHDELKKLPSDLRQRADEILYS